MRPGWFRSRGDLGPAGERLARQFLKRKGYRIVARGFRCALGELDLVALDGDTIVFVEVRARADETQQDIEESINAEKRRRLTRTAKAFLSKRGVTDRPARFDVIAINFENPDNPIVRHTIDAFAPESTRPRGPRRDAN